MRILIVGAGALGGLVGAHLTESGEEVRLLEINRARAKLLVVVWHLLTHQVYAEIGLPEPRAVTVGEKRATANNRRCLTRHAKVRAIEQAGG
jgi:2-polyprenyl-6-methoxyphenol hydroxylase-like FAD-dependent oxidoreductase